MCNPRARRTIWRRCLTDESEAILKWQLKITRVDNGYLLEGTNDMGMPNQWVVEDNEADELASHESLLWNIMEYFNFQGCKHDAVRLRVTRETQN